MWTAARLVERLARGRIDAIKIDARRACQGLIVLAAALITMMVALGYLLAAIYIALAAEIGAVQACLALFAALVILAVVLVLVGRRKMKPRNVRAAAARSEEPDVSDFAAAVGHDLGKASRSRMPTLLAAAFAAGLAAGFKGGRKE